MMDKSSYTPNITSPHNYFVKLLVRRSAGKCYRSKLGVVTALSQNQMKIT